MVSDQSTRELQLHTPLTLTRQSGHDHDPRAAITITATVTLRFAFTARRLFSFSVRPWRGFPANPHLAQQLQPNPNPTLHVQPQRLLHLHLARRALAARSHVLPAAPGASGQLLEAGRPPSPAPSGLQLLSSPWPPFARSRRLPVASLSAVSVPVTLLSLPVAFRQRQSSRSGAVVAAVLTHDPCLVMHGSRLPLPVCLLPGATVPSRHWQCRALLLLCPIVA